MDDELVAEYGITIEQYEVLSRLAQAPDRRTRQADLSDPPLVTAANVRRVLRDLERSHLVDRGEGAAIVLTDKGREKVHAADSGLSAQLEELLGSNSSEGPRQSA